jgi:hypothetical protein
MNEQNPNPQDRRSFSEEIEVTGNQLIEKVKELIEQGNVRRLIIRDQNDRALLEVPLTIGAVAGGALAIFAAPLAAIGALAALVARVKLEIVREEPAATVTDVKQAADDAADKLKNDE